MSSRLGFLGLQFAARKSRPPSLTPGPWAGSVVHSADGQVSVSVPPEKWVKAKCIVQTLLELVQQNVALNHKSLEKDRGFLVHVQHTYPTITPYIKGLHLTIDSWRVGRDSEGWKLPSSALTEIWDDSVTNPLPGRGEDALAPETVIAVPRLQDDLLALTQLLSAEVPPQRIIRSRAVVSAGYGFGDASGTGLGWSMQVGSELSITHGVWGEEDSANSSNYRELSNLVSSLERGLSTGQLKYSEFFLFTDNSAAEAVFHNGTSTSKRLFELALHLRSLEMIGDFQFHLVYVAGTQMMAQGTDGLSRGSLSEGIMRGFPMLSFVPLHLSPLSRQPGLLPWIQQWTNQPDLQPLTPTDWFRRGQGFQGTQLPSGGWTTEELSDTWHLWDLPPAAADAMLEALNESRIKRPHLNHLVLCPRLMTF